MINKQLFTTVLITLSLLGSGCSGGSSGGNDTSGMTPGIDAPVNNNPVTPNESSVVPTPPENDNPVSRDGANIETSNDTVTLASTVEEEKIGEDTTVSFSFGETKRETKSYTNPEEQYKYWLYIKNYAENGFVNWNSDDNNFYDGKKEFFSRDAVEDFLGEIKVKYGYTYRLWLERANEFSEIVARSATYDLTVGEESEYTIELFVTLKTVQQIVVHDLNVTVVDLVTDGIDAGADDIVEDAIDLDFIIHLPYKEWNEQNQIKFSIDLIRQDNDGNPSRIDGDDYTLNKDELEAGQMSFHSGFDKIGLNTLYGSEFDSLLAGTSTKVMLRVTPDVGTSYSIYQEYFEVVKTEFGVTITHNDLLAEQPTVRFDGDGTSTQCQIIVQALLNEDLNLTDQKVRWSKKTKDGRDVYLTNIDNPYEVKIYRLDDGLVNDELNLTIISTVSQDGTNALELADENETITSLYRVQLRHTGITDDACLLNLNNPELFEEKKAEDEAQSQLLESQLYN
jgi:hypothetical protein